MIVMTLGPVALMPNALSALKVMKKFIQKSEDRKLVYRNIIKDRQLFFFFFTINLKSATKDYAQIYKLTY